MKVKQSTMRWLNSSNCYSNKKKSAGSSDRERIAFSKVTKIPLFHNFASARRNKNYIKKLKSDEGDWVEGTEMLKPLVFQYFSNLFASEVEGTDPEFLEKITPRVTSEMNEKLIAPYAAEGVKKSNF
jgi:hypothetical protein